MPLQNPQDVAAHAAIPAAHHTLKTIATGSYTGNQTARQITTGFKYSLVIVLSSDGLSGNEGAFLIPGISIKDQGNSLASMISNASLHATDGFETDLSATLNKTGATYYYWAISE